MIMKYACTALLGALLICVMLVRADWIEFSSAGTDKNLSLRGRLFKPDGDGPFAAVVLLHGCSGLGQGGVAQQVEFAWAKRFQEWGYVALAVDSFMPRGLPEGVRTLPDAKRLSSSRRTNDAYGALDYLRAQPFINPEKIAVVGWSNGGVAVLNTMNLDLHADRKHGFVSGVTFYPECGLDYGKWRVTRQCGDSGSVTSSKGVYQPIAALLILSGEADDWTPAQYCKSMVDAAKSQDYPLELIMYPGAHHSFDGGGNYFYIAGASNINKCNACCGGTVGGNNAATEDAIQQVKVFLLKHFLN